MSRLCVARPPRKGGEEEGRRFPVQRTARWAPESEGAGRLPAGVARRSASQPDSA